MTQDASAATVDPHPHRGRDTRHRQSMLRVQCPRCGGWFTQTLDGGGPRRHKCEHEHDWQGASNDRVVCQTCGAVEYV